MQNTYDNVLQRLRTWSYEFGFPTSFINLLYFLRRTDVKINAFLKTTRTMESIKNNVHQDLIGHVCVCVGGGGGGSDMHVIHN